MAQDPHWAKMAAALDSSFSIGGLKKRVKETDAAGKEVTREVNATREEAQAGSRYDKPSAWRLREDPRWGGLGGAPGAKSEGTPISRAAWVALPAIQRAKTLTLFLQKCVAHCRTVAPHTMFEDWCGEWYDESHRLNSFREMVGGPKRWALLSKVAMYAMYESYLHSGTGIYNMEELLEQGTTWESGGSSDGQEIASRIPAYNGEIFKRDGKSIHVSGSEPAAYAGSNAHIQASLDESAESAKEITVELFGERIMRSLRILPFAVEGWEAEPFEDGGVAALEAVAKKMEAEAAANPRPSHGYW